jgi:TolB-like protein/AraC-like DNA-binding protein
MEDEFIVKLTGIVDTHIKNPDFGVDELARDMGISYLSLNRKLRKLSGKSVNQFIREIRLKKAWELLQDDSVTAAEVAFQTGFGSAAYFNTSFHRYFGYPPGEARKLKVAEVEEALKPEKNIRNHRQFRRFSIAGVGILLGAAGLMFLLTSSGWLREEKSIAVLPFHNISPDSLGEYYSEILWDEVISSLHKVKVFDVRSGISSGRFRNTDKSIPEIGRKLDAAYIVDGSVGLEDDQVKVWIHLIDSKTNHQFWSQDYSFNLGATHERLNTIAQNIAYHLKTKLLPWEKAAQQLRGTTNDEAWYEYLKGSYWIDYEHDISPDRAQICFRKAISLDSSWADPYLGLALALSFANGFDPLENKLEERLKTIQKAQSLKESQDTYLLLAQYYMQVNNYKKAKKLYLKTLKGFPENYFWQDYKGYIIQSFGKWKKAEKIQLQNLQLYPESVQFNMTLLDYYDRKRDFPTAVKYYKQAKAVGPAFGLLDNFMSDIMIKWKGDTYGARKIIEDREQWNPSVGGNAMEPLYRYIMIDIYEGKYQEAIDVLSNYSLRGNSMVIFRPKYLLAAWAHGYLGNHEMELAYYDSTRRYIEGLTEEFPLFRDEPSISGCLGIVWMGLGNPDKALEVAERTIDLISAKPDLLTVHYAWEDVAWVYAKTGNYRKAFKILNKLLSEPGSLTVKVLDLDPRWEFLREMPQFKKLRMKYAIPSTADPVQASVR